MENSLVVVSVIIPYYNSEQTIKRALMSVRDQTFQQPIEIIIVNDGSSDHSQDIVEAFIKQHPQLSIQHIVQENAGPSKARNVGMRRSSGKYISFLDSDDSWHSDKLVVQVRYMEEHPDVVITGTNYYINSSKITKYGEQKGIVEANFRDMLFKVFFCMPTVVVRRDVIEQEHIYFMEGKHYGEDLLFYLQIIRKYRGVRISKPLAKLHKFLYGQGGLTKDLSKLLINELDNATILYRQNAVNQVKMSFWLYHSLLGYSVLKHYVRIYKSRKYRKLA